MSRQFRYFRTLYFKRISSKYECCIQCLQARHIFWENHCLNNITCQVCAFEGLPNRLLCCSRAAQIHSFKTHCFYLLIAYRPTSDRSHVQTKPAFFNIAVRIHRPVILVWTSVHNGMQSMRHTDSFILHHCPVCWPLLSVVLLHYGLFCAAEDNVLIN
jgi:hypothetical protein